MPVQTDAGRSVQEVRMPVQTDAGRSVQEAGMPVQTDTVMLKITHGTGDDNVHYQNTLQLLDELHKKGRKFDFMIYPDGMHGYRGYQGRHFKAANREFWLKYLF